MGEVIDLSDKLRSIRQERYAMQSVAKLALPGERVGMCLRIVNNKSSVEVWKHLKTDRAFFNGLLVCGSVWSCPVCAAKISERRKGELLQATEQHKSSGGKLAFITFTFSHKTTDRLKDILKRFSDAMMAMKRQRAFKEIMESMGRIGHVQNLEVTYSNRNGFHPHRHELIFYTNEVDLKEIEKKLYRLWEKACAKFGLTTIEGIGLDLQNGDAVEAYLSKHGTWSLEQEMTKSHIKKAKFDSYSPFDFLRSYLQTNDARFLKLYQEYAEAFKGKTQLKWSRGLKQRFNIEDKSDEVVAKEKLENADLLGLLTYEQWKVILKKDSRSRFLDYTERFGFETAVNMLIDKKKESSCDEDSVYQLT